MHRHCFTTRYEELAKLFNGHTHTIQLILITNSQNVNAVTNYKRYEIDLRVRIFAAVWSSAGVSGVVHTEALMEVAANNLSTFDIICHSITKSELSG